MHFLQLSICCCSACSLLCLFSAPHKSANSLCAFGHRRVLEYSLGYSSSTRVTNYSVSAALEYRGDRSCKVRASHTGADDRMLSIDLTSKERLKRKWIYIAPLLKYLTLKALRYRSHSVYLQTTPYLPLPRKHSPDGASQTVVVDI